MILKLPISVALLFTILITQAQFVLRIELNQLPANHPGRDPVYAAGSFNGWNPADEQYKFSHDKAGNYFLELKLTPGVYEYKLTRGSWAKVECNRTGESIANRTLKVEEGSVIKINVEDWQDMRAAPSKKSTASKNVQVIKNSFFIPQLNRTRRVWIYLPENYATSRERYPVLYMHDGQNIFEDSTSYSGEWGIDEFLDSTKAKKCIVVAIDHGNASRLNEYCPYDMTRFGKGEGNQYVTFLAKTLKPYIDRRYRTLRKRQYTYIAGSSMGGLISFYAMLKYPKVFGGAGVFSPAFWIAPGIYDDIRAKGKKVKSRIFFYAGKQEGETMVPQLLKAFGEIAAISHSKITTVIRDEGKHNEATWRMEFPLFYQWIIQ
jgi:predicted alpha/beta superfamily hydrolase